MTFRPWIRLTGGYARYENASSFSTLQCEFQLSKMRLAYHLSGPGDLNGDQVIMIKGNPFTAEDSGN